jgi:hypothetical protein
LNKIPQLEKKKEEHIFKDIMGHLVTLATWFVTSSPLFWQWLMRNSSLNQYVFPGHLLFVSPSGRKIDILPPRRPGCRGGSVPCFPTYLPSPRRTGIGYHYHTLLDIHVTAKIKLSYLSPSSVCSKAAEALKIPESDSSQHDSFLMRTITDPWFFIQRWALDFQGNAERILQSIREAKAAGASWVLVLGGEGGKICWWVLDWGLVRSWRLRGMDVLIISWSP